MNQSPEARLLTRYAMTVVLGVLALVIGPRAFATPLLRVVWYVSGRTLAVARRRRKWTPARTFHGVHD